MESINETNKAIERIQSEMYDLGMLKSKLNAIDREFMNDRADEQAKQQTLPAPPEEIELNLDDCSKAEEYNSAIHAIVIAPEDCEFETIRQTRQFAKSLKESIGYFNINAEESGELLVVLKKAPSKELLDDIAKLERSMNAHNYCGTVHLFGAENSSNSRILSFKVYQDDKENRQHTNLYYYIWWSNQTCCL